MPRAALATLAGLFLLAVAWRHRAPDESPPAANASVVSAPTWNVSVAPPAIPRGLEYTFPTPQTRLRDLEDPTVFMPTASGRVISAHYGSTRTNASGQAVFHEGVDIGPMRRDRVRRALDPIFAVADGTVAYANRVAGNSTYGIYIVLTHEDELGTFYTLYAHLASVAGHIREGRPVLRGETIGVMGHTSSFNIPVERAHLHFEIGVINNMRFAEWYRGKRRTPDHGTWHGHNLTGIDPMLLLLGLEVDGENRFSMLDALRELPTAYTLAVHARAPWDYFRRHPMLWEGEPFTGNVMVVEFCEAGTPLRGRNATPEEREGVTASRPRVLDVNREALGRNGRRKIVPAGRDAWRLSPWGMEWLEVLGYGS